MKKLLLFSILVLLNFSSLFSQNWEWSKKTSSPNANYYQRGMFSDNSGLIYTYGSRPISNYYYSSPLIDTIGSYMECYSSTGNLVFRKRWAFPFYITKIAYDGNTAVYFSACFYGSQTIDGTTVSAIGECDGAVGKMDLNGNLIWINTFGEPGADFAMGICYNPSNGFVYSTGSIKDTLIVNHQYKSHGQQSGIISSWSSTGVLLQNKLYDYVPERDSWYANKGLEIACNNNGDLFVLADRDGRNWGGGDTVAAPEIGRYIMKLNPALDTIWSKYIIGPSCYYGFSCHAMAVSDAGDVYVSNRCSHKYGGDARITKLNGANGSVNWNYPNNDGHYRDIYVQGNLVYVIGNEVPNGCPCPSSTSGYNIIKIFDSNNTLLGETRAYAGFYNIIKSSDGGIYVSGGFGNRTCALGPDKLTADSTLSSSGSYYSYQGSFLSRLGNINCTAPSISVNIGSVYGHYYTLCPGDTATLTTNCNTGSFLWSNSITAAQSTTTSSGTYSLVNTQPNGCVAYSLPVSIIVNPNEHSHKICQVSYDSVSGKNKILVVGDDYQEYSDVRTVYLYMESNGNTTLVNSQTNGYMYSEGFIDSTTSPNDGPVTYVVKTTDSCGTLSPFTLSHTTIHLTANENNGKTTLHWNHYSGFPVSKYYVWKGNDKASLVLYDSVSKISTNYTDPDWLRGSYYQVMAMNGNYGCYYSNTSYRGSFSNPATARIVGIVEKSKPGKYEISTYPNPAKDIFTINCSSEKSAFLNLSIHNSLGEIIYSEELKNFKGEYNKILDLANHPKGIYYLKVSLADDSTSRKIILQ